ncbi:MAG: hypothetical protein DWQ35_15380 [Planctomycetota bacterium]|nr:MAG: hypothetical protein DWQ35_15380 [Planctomycetota bacterium]
MATVAAADTSDIAIHSRLDKLRGLIRGYLAGRGLAYVIIAAALLFWLSLLVDWLFEPSRAVRLLMLLAVGVALLAVVIRSILRPLLMRLSDKSLALLLERRFDELGDRLVTSVELGDSSASRGPLAKAMLATTQARAGELAQEVPLGRVLRRRPLVLAIALAVVSLMSIGGFGWFLPEATATWADRTLMLGDEQWPRATKIYVDGFEPDEQGRRIVKVARGSDLQLTARADLRGEWIAPDLLEVHYDTDEGGADRTPMSKRGRAIAGRDDFQEFRFEFQDLQSTTRFSVVAVRRGVWGKDDRVDNLVIEAVSPPDIENISLRCQFPDYLGKEAADLPVTGIMTLPEGTEVEVLAQASKPLQAATWRQVGDAADAERAKIVIDQQDRRRMTLALGEVTANMTLLFTLEDTDGVSNQQPIRLRLLAQLDEIPLVDARPVGVGSAVTPQARIPVAGELTDDHGLTNSWFQIEAADAAPQRVEFDLPPEGRLDKQSGPRLNVSELAVVLGEKFRLTLRAADNYPLGDEPHVGSSERFEFEVITEDELRARLESKEVFLRQRLSSVADELIRVSDTLTRTRARLDPVAAEDAAADDGDAEPAAGAEAAAAPRSKLPLNALAIEEALQSRDRTQNEILDITAEFDSILEELINNNVSYLEKTQERMQGLISRPLKRLIKEDYRAWGIQLRQVRANLEDRDRAVESLDVARAQLAAILQEIEEVLLKMEDFGNFQESLARLRKIIADHKEISRLTRERREQIKRDLRRRLLD